jgi:hypothetical protein
MTIKEKESKNPVARLREKFLEKKKNRMPSDVLKETLIKKQERPAQEDGNKKIAKPRTEVDL